ncbi:hypothetical protein VE02_05267 [Pseudogymnoascus sp. 03VT05]|nr:hypothetical protein VE02_05267 [Pseudogymnoascus sp. 03VT05]
MAPEAGLADDGPAEETQTVYLKSDIQKQLVRKIDMNLMPLVYLLAFLDRSNIGNAQTAGMGKSLGMSDGEYQWLLTNLLHSVYYI